MTTIAWRDGILAADSRSMVGGWIEPHWVQKIFRMPDSRLVAITGNQAEARKLVNWLRERDRQDHADQPTGDCRAIVMHTDKRVQVYEDGCSYFATGSIGAYGSGAPAALGALHAGATAEEAIRIAALLDPNTGGHVTWAKAGNSPDDAVRVYDPSSSPQSRAEA
jgi:20S proteasome alpha/beta subunit